MTNVYTYYSPVEGLPISDADAWALIDVWRRSWAKAGWNPVILTEDTARRHPRYAEFKRKFWELPTIYGHNYECACFLRYAAMSAVGGGLLTDYDVINYAFPPCRPDPERMSVIADRDVTLFTGTVLAPYELFEGVCQMFFEWVPDARDWHAQAGQHNCSDLALMQQMLDSKNRPCPAWLHWTNGCTLFPKISGPLVHYAYAMRAAGHWPKHAWIEKLRPF